MKLNYSFRWTPLSCQTFRDSEARLRLHALAYNLATFLCGIELPKAIADGSLTCLQLKLIKLGARVVLDAHVILFRLVVLAVIGPIVRAVLASIRRLRALLLCTSPRSKRKLNKSGRTCLSAALKNTAAEPEHGGFTT